MLTPTAARLFSYLPQETYGWDETEADPLLLRILQALADELDRARQVLTDLRDSSIPAMADDRVGSLSRWERTLKLTVAPAGDSEAVRRARVVASIIGRRAARGADWTAAMEAAIGSPDWTVEENEPFPQMLRIQVPYTGSASVAQVESFARRITPAHLEIVMRYAEGWIVGVSRVGDAI